MTEDDAFRLQAQAMKALASEARLKIINRLSRGRSTVGELTRFVGLDQSTVSKHLSLLKAQSVVRDRRKGNNVYYELFTPCVMNFFSCAMQLLQERRGQ